MSTPHMTGRGSSASAGGGRAVSDLLDDDGKVDLSAIRAAANEGADRADRVQPSDASEMRRHLLRGATTHEVADEMGFGAETVRDHARGDRSYPRGGTPEMPPLEYGPGGWEVVDE